MHCMPTSDRGGEPESSCQAEAVKMLPAITPLTKFLYFFMKKSIHLGLVVTHHN